jgi:hypothetical protein
MMALFQPFKPTKRMPGSKLVAATYRQGLLDQQAKRDENALRSANTNRLTALADKGLAWNEKEGNPIGNYLRDMYTDAKVELSGGDQGTQGLQVEGQGMQSDAPPGELSETYGAGPMSPAGQPSALSAQPGIGGNAPISDLTGGDTASSGGSLFAPTYAAPDDLALEGSTDVAAQAGADTGEAAADDSIRGMLESLFSGGGDAATEAAVEQGTEQLAEAGAEGAAEAAGSSAMPGLGSIASLAEGDVKGAAAKYALSMLPPPYNLLAMLV